MAPFQSGRGWQEGQPPAPLGVFAGGILYQAGQRAVVQNPDGSYAGGSLLEGTCRALCPLCRHRPLPASGGLSLSGGPRLGWHHSARSRSSPQRASSAHPPSLGSGALVQFSPSRSCPGLCHGAACLPGLEQDPATLQQDLPGQDPARRMLAVPVTSFPSPGGTGGQLARGT